MIGRRPRSTETHELLRAFEQQRAYYSAAVDQAKAIVQLGEWPVDQTLDPAEVAAMTAVIQLVMNFHEFQMKL